MENCKKLNEAPLMYSQFCYYVQQNEQKHRASITSIDPNKDISMREVYGLDKSLRE